MKKLFLLLTITFNSFIWASAVMPDTYYIDKDKNLTFIYAKEYHDTLPAIRSDQTQIMQKYTKEFGFNLDEKLYIGLASHNNQKTNGYTTQIPFNSQLLFGTGAESLDYFATVSWLKILQIHESAHTFQLNAKENIFSKWGHKIFGNTLVSAIGPLVIFPLPNYFVGSFLLEGNAVLNESRFGIGGRLYSGAVLAQNILLAQADKITPELMFNSTLAYPYRENWYFEGGMFQAFLAKKYGVEKVNGFFKTYSKQYFPFAVNSTFESYYGKSFEALLGEFKEALKMKHKGFHKTQGKVLAHTQKFIPMTKHNGMVATLITDLKSVPKLLEINKEGNISKLENRSFLLGQVFAKNGKYYTQSSYLPSPTRVVKGLYDEDAMLLKKTDSKVIQGFKPNGQMVYMDVNRSLEKMHIYIDNSFYDTSSSRVLVDYKGDLYYFKQKGKMRTLYKNREKLFSYEGYYGYVTDVDSKGMIYIIAPSMHGTTAYGIKDGQLKRVTQGDDVVDVKVLDNGKLLLASMSDNGFNYTLQTTQNKKADIPQFTYAFEDKKDEALFNNADFPHTQNSKKLKPYHALTSLKYSSLLQTIGYDSTNGIRASANIFFTDPLMRNSVNIFASKESDYSLAGIAYDNSAYQLHFGASFVSVLDNNESKKYNDYGYSAYIKYPFLRSGYWRADIGLDYVQSFENIYQKPVTFTLDISQTKHYGISKYANAHNAFSLFASTDRGNLSYGASYTFMHDIVNQSYFSLCAKYIKSDEANTSTEKGISINKNGYESLSTPNNITITGLGKEYYADEVMMAEAGLYKVFDASAYFFSFPISLQRESFYVKQRYYQIKSEEKTFKYNESVVGMSVDLLAYHQLTLPLRLEWIHNEDVENKDRFNVGIDFQF